MDQLLEAAVRRPGEKTATLVVRPRLVARASTAPLETGRAPSEPDEIRRLARAGATPRAGEVRVSGN